MNSSSPQPSENFEQRLDALKREASLNGIVSTGAGVRAAGGPLPLNTSEALLGDGYYGQPIIKPPVWEWMIAVYFFVGGVAGMSGLIAAATLIRDQFQLTRIAMWAAGIGAILSPILLTLDLGRPRRFMYMLRVFKYQSPMSVGSWIVAGFGAFAVPGLVFSEWHWHNLQNGNVIQVVHVLATVAIIGSGLIGIFLATYTGALIAATAVPAWNVHRVLLPFHFGMAGLGSAAALPLLAGISSRALLAILLFTAAAETVVQLTLELGKHGDVDRPLREGSSGWTLRSGEVLAGPVSLILAALGITTAAAISFLAGALIARFGWLNAGRASACVPQSVLASQRGPQPRAQTHLPFSLTPPVASAGSLKKT